MFKVICVTHRAAVKGDFLTQLEKICAGGIDRIILREKDLTENEYEQLALQVSEICGAYGVPLSLHTYAETAKKLGTDIHLAYDMFMNEYAYDSRTVGVSVHDPGEAEAVCDSKASYVIAGHIFETACKKGLPPRGIDFLKDICRQTADSGSDVYAIGGITPENTAACKKAGASGVCLMSSLMLSQRPAELIYRIRKNASDGA